MSDEQDIARAGRARQILDDPMVKAAFEEVEHKMTQAWKSSPVTDSEGRERLFRVILGMQEFRAFFEVAISNGQVAEYQINAFARQGMRPKA